MKPSLQEIKIFGTVFRARKLFGASEKRPPREQAQRTSAWEATPSNNRDLRYLRNYAST